MAANESFHEDDSTVFVTRPESHATTEQRERVLAVLDRGIYIVAIVALIMLLMALIVTLSGQGTWRWWVTPVALFALAAGMFFVIQRLEARPEGAIEVPAEYGQDFADMHAARDETVRAIEAELGGAYEPADLNEVTSDLDEALDSAARSAQEIVRLRREGLDAGAEEDAFTDALDVVFEIHDQFVLDAFDEDDESFTGRDL